MAGCWQGVGLGGRRRVTELAVRWIAGFGGALRMSEMEGNTIKTDADDLIEAA